MKKNFAVLTALCASVFGGTEIRASETDELASRVFVVAAANDAESLELAGHYMKKRNIPEENLIALVMPDEETISWKTFAEELHAPLIHELSRRELIDGEITEKRDAAGRLVPAIPRSFNPENARAASQIAYLVLCRGVPLRIQNDPTKLPPLPPAKEGEPAPKRQPLETNCASVDSELALIAVPGLPVNGVVPNPFFKDADSKLPKKLFLKVARLDGITLADAKALVDNALAAEKKGLMGRAYIDIGGPHKQGDDWLAKTEKIVRELGFDTTTERSKNLIPVTSRYDAPAFYFGWYTQNVGGFFLDPNFRFPSGTCAIHIHSFSATSMRSKTAWTPGLVARGVTATVGNVYEPYLGFSHYPHYFAEALASGMRAGDAAAFANPVFSWQTIFVGDPLYRPFKTSLDAQLAEAKTGFPTRLHQYAFLRASNLARAKKQDDEADKILRSARFYAPGLALEYAAAKNDFSKTHFLNWNYKPSNLALENPGLVLELVGFIAEHGKADAAVKFYSELLARNFIPDNARVVVLREAIACAEKYHVASAPVYAWREELKRLSAAKTSNPTKK